MGEPARVDETIMKVTVPVRMEVHRREGQVVHVAVCKPFEVTTEGPTQAEAKLALRVAVAEKLRRYTR